MIQSTIDINKLKEKVILIKRVTKVVKGGRNFKFTALVVIGDYNNHVGAAIGKASEIPEAIRKGKEKAIKYLITISKNNNDSIFYDFIGKFNKSKVLLKKAPNGTGIIASSVVRTVIELSGIKNIRAKCIGSRNQHNIVMATLIGLKQIKTPYEVSKLRGKSIKNIHYILK